MRSVSGRPRAEATRHLIPKAKLQESRRFRHATSRLRLLPSFLIIGAQQAGTESLFAALRRHPNVVAPYTSHQGVRPREPHFFDRNFSYGVGWYRSCFPLMKGRLLRRLRGRDLIAGEATPTYLAHPDVPARVAATVPGVVLIALLRDPVERAYWHYEWMRRIGLEPLSLADALHAEDERMAVEEQGDFRPGVPGQYAYVGRGLYADQIERWLAFFPRERFLAISAEDYATRPREVYPEVLDFLELEPRLPRRFQSANWMGTAQIDPTVRVRLEERFAEPNARLRRLLGQEFAWAAETAHSEAPRRRPGTH